MMNFVNEEDKISSAVKKILRQTKENVIKWECDNKGDNFKGLGVYENLIGYVYFADISTKKLRLYKYKTRYYTDEDEFIWMEYHRLEFYDIYTDLTEWVFPATNAISDLYEAVMHQTSKIDDFLSDFLDD